jgi:type VI secretion system secreted protein Hcp
MMDSHPQQAYIVKPVPGGELGVRGAAITMKVKGQKSGDVDGQAPKTIKGAEGHFQLIYAQSAITSPRDPQSGLPTGQRMHQGLEVVGRCSKGTVILWSILCNNENMPEVTVNFWSQSGQGAGVSQKVFYKIHLTNASLASMEHMTSEVDGTLFFRGRFTYERINWTWLEGGFEAEDNWQGAK